MCLIMLNKNGNLDKADFDLGLKKNRDGLGILYVKNGRVVAKKSMSIAQRDVLFDEVNNQQGVKLLHMRYATHGKKDVERLHPFKILSLDEGDPIDLWCMHNGMLQEVESDVTRSDTQIFIEDYLTPILKSDHTLIQNLGFQKMLDVFIGYNNKLVFLDNHSNVTLINEQAGLWTGGTWLSSPHYVNKGKHYTVSAGGTYSYGDKPTYRDTTPAPVKTYTKPVTTTSKTTTTASNVSYNTKTGVTTVGATTTTATGAKVSTGAKEPAGKSTATVSSSTTTSGTKTTSTNTTNTLATRVKTAVKKTVNLGTDKDDSKEVSDMSIGDVLDSVKDRYHNCDNCLNSFHEDEMNFGKAQNIKLCDKCLEKYKDMVALND